MAAALQEYITIVDNETIKIEKIGSNEYLLTLYLYRENRDLHNIVFNNLVISLKNILGDSSVDTDVGDVSGLGDDDSDIFTTINIKCDSIQTLTQYLSTKNNLVSYNEALCMFLDIGNFCKNLENERFVFPFFSISDFIVINNNRFIISDFKELQNIEEDISRSDYSEKQSMIRITKPYKHTRFFSREFHTVKSLPSYLPSNMWLFSLAVCVIFSLTNEENIYMRSIPSYMKIIDNIENTKLYYALLRCLENDSRKRIFLYV